MTTSRGSARWDGGLKDGKGAMKPAHGNDAMFSFGSRFEGQPSSNPEELIGAALAGCFSMALSHGLEKGGFKPRSVVTSANVQIGQSGEGFELSTIELSTQANVPGIDATKFQTIAEEAKKNCPVSKALAGAKITLSAKLAAS